MCVGTVLVRLPETLDRPSPRHDLELFCKSETDTRPPSERLEADMTTRWRITQNGAGLTFLELHRSCDDKIIIGYSKCG